MNRVQGRNGSTVAIRRPPTIEHRQGWDGVDCELSLVLEAHHTTHIEGTQLTLEQAQRLMCGETVPEADPDDVREFLNYRQALERVGLPG